MSINVDVMEAPGAPSRPTEDDGVGCLSTKRGNLPLESIDVQAAITGLASSIQVTQGFQNPYDEPLEATYIFPLPPRAAVTALRMEADGRVVEGLLKERAEAREEYDQAISAGQACLDRRGGAARRVHHAGGQHHAGRERQRAPDAGRCAVL